MIPFEKCPICGGAIIQKEVEKILRGAANTVILKVNTVYYNNLAEFLQDFYFFNKFFIRSRLDKITVNSILIRFINRSLIRTC